MGERNARIAKIVKMLMSSKVSVGDVGFGSIESDKAKYLRACEKMSERLGIEAKNQGKLRFEMNDHAATQQKNLTASAYVLSEQEVKAIAEMLREKIQ